MFTIVMAKQRHRLESTISDGSVTRSKHMIGYCVSWKMDLQWCIPVYDSSASIYDCRSVVPCLQATRHKAKKQHRDMDMDR